MTYTLEALIHFFLQIRNGGRPIPIISSMLNHKEHFTVRTILDLASACGRYDEFYDGIEYLLYPRYICAHDLVLKYIDFIDDDDIEVWHGLPDPPKSYGKLFDHDRFIYVRNQEKKHLAERRFGKDYGLYLNGERIYPRFYKNYLRKYINFKVFESSDILEVKAPSVKLLIGPCTRDQFVRELGGWHNCAGSRTLKTC